MLRDIWGYIIASSLFKGKVPGGHFTGFVGKFVGYILSGITVGKAAGWQRFALAQFAMVDRLHGSMASGHCRKCHATMKQKMECRNYGQRVAHRSGVSVNPIVEGLTVARPQK